MAARPLVTLVLLACAAGCAQAPIDTKPIALARDLPVPVAPQRTATQASTWEKLPEMPPAAKPVPPATMAVAEPVEGFMESATQLQPVAVPVRTVWDRIRNGFELAPMDNDLVPIR